MAQTLQVPAVKQGIRTWEIDPAHSNAQFSVRHLMISNVKGEFTGISGRILFDPQKPEALSAEAAIDVSTINTRERDRDNHLKSPDFFHVEEYPTITFKSKRAEKSSDGLKLTGDLTIHGVTREVTLDVEGPTPPTKGSLGQYPSRRFSNHQNQPQRLWPHVESGARNRRRPGGRRDQNHGGRGTGGAGRR